MNNHDPGRMSTSGASRKRKDRDTFYKSSDPSTAEPLSSNRLLAGYMAYEFLTKGTLFGQKLARAEAVPLRGSYGGGGEAKKAEAVKKEQQSKYAEVASILKMEGAHIPGIVNPTQLARWIQM